MRGLKLLILSLLITGMAMAQTSYVQNMGYNDYSFRDQLNIGNITPKRTHASAYLELGKPSGSTRGFLLPRGTRGSVVSPAEGLVFYDMFDKKVFFFDGTSWVSASAGSSSTKVDSVKVRNDSLFYFHSGGSEFFAGLLTAVPQLQQVLEAGGTTTGNIITSGNVAGAEVRTATGKVTATEVSDGAGTYGWLLVTGTSAGEPSALVGPNSTNDGRGEWRGNASVYKPIPTPGNVFLDYGYIYFKTDGKPYWKWNGTETAFGTGSGGITQQQLDDSINAVRAAIPTRKSVQTFTDGATITLDFNTTSGWKGTIAGNRTFTISNLPSNEVMLVTVTQDATAGRTPTFTGVTWLGTLPAWPTTGGKSTVCSFWYDGGKIWGKRENE